MLNWYYPLAAKLRGRNSNATPKSVIAAQLDELRPLPIGRDQFMEWSERILSGALVDADPDSQRFALASMVLQLGPNEAFKADKHFVSQLRKVAANQTAHTMAQEFKLAAQARFEAEKAALAQARFESEKAAPSNAGTDVKSLVNAVPDVTAGLKALKDIDAIADRSLAWADKKLKSDLSKA